MISSFTVSFFMEYASGAGTAYPSGAPEFSPVFNAVRFAQSLVFCAVFCRSFLFFLPLYCLTFFDLWLLITPSNFTYKFQFYI